MPNKSLGQHWLKDRLILEAIADSIPIDNRDVVMEIGPGLGTLTSVLLGHAKKVVAIEYDKLLAGKLPAQFPGKNLEVLHQDFLEFDTGSLTDGYKVVANVPYYITTKIIEKLIRSDNRPQSMALLVQQEVAEKLSGNNSLYTSLGVEMMIDYDIHLGIRVPKEYFTPPPMVGSQVLICIKKHESKYAEFDKKKLLRIVKAGFAQPRKKLRASLSAGLAMSKDMTDDVLKVAGVDSDKRAQNITIDEWVGIMKSYDSLSSTKMLP